MSNRGTRTPASLRDASSSAVTGAIGRARARTASRRKSSALPAPSSGALARPAPAPARRARSSLPPLPYGARVSRHGKRPAKPVVGGDNADDDDDDDDGDGDGAGDSRGDGEDVAEDDWEDFQECDAAAAAAVSASLAVAAAEAEARGVEAADGTGTKEEIAEKKKAAAKAEAKRRRLATRLRNVQLLNRYQTHVSLLCAMLLRMDAAADDEHMQALALSMLPLDAVLGSTAVGKPMEVLRRFALWFRFTFQSVRLVEGKPVRRKCSVAERAEECLEKRRGDLLDLVVVAAAAIRATGTRCRVVMPMQTMAFKEAASSRFKNVSGRKVEAVAHDRTKLAGLYAWAEVFIGNRWVHLDPVAGLVDAATEKDICQVMCPEDPSLMADPVDKATRAAARRKMKRPQTSGLPTPSSKRSMTMADLRKRDNPPIAVKPSISHVVATESGYLSDVTRRYVDVWLDVQKERPPSGLFEKTLASCCSSSFPRRGKSFDVGRTPSTETGGSSTRVLSASQVGDSLSSASASRRVCDLEDNSFPMTTFTGRAADNEDDVAATSEQLEFDRRAMKEAVPKTLSALRTHQLYVVERHLKRYEAIYPKEPVLGYVGPEKEPVYLRSHVRMLHTRDRWNREMRSVKQDELPIKTVAAKGKRDSDGVLVPSDSDLFGEWQTGPLVVPAVKDGIVPRNERGNIDLWTPAHMPKGGVHVPLQHAASVARQLGFDYAPCMTGFEVRSGRSVPRIEGVVVAEEYEEVVRDGALAAGQRAKERAESRSREEALARWKELLRCMKERLRVQQKYGGVLGDDAEGTFEAIQRRRGKAKERRSSAHERTTADSLNGSREKVESQNKRPRVAADAHEHVFDATRHHEGDIWIKTCSICGIEVPFEKL